MILALGTAALLLGQTAAAPAAPLRKSDLVRLLSGSSLSQPELTQLVSRNCLTFDPTDRDRTDFRRLGAERELLAALEACARRSATRRAAPRATPTPAPAAKPGPGRVPLTPAAPAAVRVTAAADRSGFVAGGGQRGPAGARLLRPLVFEVRDSAGAPLAGEEVVFTGVNARTEPAVVATDAAGQARAGVWLGERAGSATVLATVGAVEKQVAFNVAAGPAAQLIVTCGAASLAGRFAIGPDSVIVLRVVAQDGLANAAPLTGLRAAVADARIARVLRIAQDTLSGTVALKPERPGTTSLAVIASGLRQYLMVTVPPRAAPGQVDCR
jgi:hypothetical protein